MTGTAASRQGKIVPAYSEILSLPVVAQSGTLPSDKTALACFKVASKWSISSRYCARQNPKHDGPNFIVRGLPSKVAARFD
jgi:hypothetical protein